MNIKTLVNFQKKFDALYEQGLIGIQPGSIHVEFTIWVQFKNDLNIQSWSVRDNHPYMTHSFIHEGIEFVGLTEKKEESDEDQ